MGAVAARVGRQSWGEAVRFPLKTERECRKCGCVRVTRHDAGPSRPPWIEFWLNGERLSVEGGRTPVCEGLK